MVVPRTNVTYRPGATLAGYLLTAATLTSEGRRARGVINAMLERAGLTFDQTTLSLVERPDTIVLSPPLRETFPQALHMVNALWGTPAWRDLVLEMSAQLEVRGCLAVNHHLQSPSTEP